MTQQGMLYPVLGTKTQTQIQVNLVTGFIHTASGPQPDMTSVNALYIVKKTQGKL